MEDINLTPWLSIAGLAIAAICFAVVIWRSRKNNPSDYVRRDLWILYWMLAIVIALLLVDRVYIYVCFH